MFQQSRETGYLESVSVFVQAFRWRKPLMITTISAALLAFVFSGPTFIVPKYKSSVVFFPPATNSLSKALFEENVSDKQDLMAFGTEEEAEQMLQLLNSDAIRDAIVRKYDLFTHYGISKDSDFPMTRLHEEYRDNISFSRTEFMSVRIDVLDRDPQMAADIANDIAALLDSIKNSIRRDRAQEASSILSRACEVKAASIRIKEDSLKSIRALGVMDYISQSAVYSEEFAKAYATLNQEEAALAVLESAAPMNGLDTAILRTKVRRAGAAAGVKAFRGKLNQLASHGDASVALGEELEADRKELFRMRQQLDRLKVDTEQGLSNKFVVNKASRAERKSTPVRWLIVLSTAFGSFVLSFMLLSLLERFSGREA
ncbi:MAG: hypothetical protein RL021_90 [Bacteroidota bacterium]|jgi:capsular polysaccharide biosynthesis protein